MKKKNKGRCTAKLWGFTCQKEEGHKDPHTERGLTSDNAKKYVIVWTDRKVIGGSENV